MTLASGSRLGPYALWWQGRNEQPVLPNLQLSIAPPAGAQFQIGANSGNVSLSPDGLKVASRDRRDSGASQHFS